MPEIQHSLAPAIHKIILGFAQQRSKPRLQLNRTAQIITLWFIAFQDLADNFRAIRERVGPELGNDIQLL